MVTIMKSAVVDCASVAHLGSIGFGSARARRVDGLVGD
jgi:hypothetical protein